MEITVENHNDGDVLTYPLAVLRGTVARKECTRIYINASEEGVEHVQCDVVSGAFIAVYELQPGRNELKLAYETDELEDDTESVLTLVLLYEEPSSERAFVRPVYLLPADVDFDGSFQSPDTPECPNDIESGFRRLRTAALIVQTAVAEMMHARGHGRRTIALGEVTKCAIPDLPLSVAHNITDDMKLWHAAYDALKSQPRRHDSIDLAVMSFSRMVGGRVRAHTALGGGALALFGGATLWSWPECVCDIPAALRDHRAFDHVRYFDDSADRARKAGGGRRMVTATTLGALVHELTHCLSLPHPVQAGADRGDVMARGFDYIDRIFVQPSLDRSEPTPCYSPGSAARLRWHRYLQFEGEAELRRERTLKARGIAGGVPRFTTDSEGCVVCKAHAGLGQLAYYVNGDQGAAEIFKEDVGEFKLLPVRFTLPREDEIRRKANAKPKDELAISAIDADGNITEMKYNEIKK